MPAPLDFSWFLLIVPALSAGVGAYVGGYLKTKGTNLATHEDIDKVVEQVRAVTQTAKEIEAKISDAVWDRQRRWEMKRDALFSALKAMAAINEALVRLRAVLSTFATPDNVTPWNLEIRERMELWRTASKEFDEVKLLVMVICDKTTVGAIDGFSQLANNVCMAMLNEHNPAKYDERAAELAGTLFAARAAIRNELGIEDK